MRAKWKMPCASLQANQYRYTRHRKLVVDADNDPHKRPAVKGLFLRDEQASDELQESRLKENADYAYRDGTAGAGEINHPFGQLALSRLRLGCTQLLVRGALRLIKSGSYSLNSMSAAAGALSLAQRLAAMVLLLF